MRISFFITIACMISLIFISTAEAAPNPGWWKNLGRKLKKLKDSVVKTTAKIGGSAGGLMATASSFANFIPGGEKFSGVMDKVGQGLTSAGGVAQNLVDKQKTAATKLTAYV